MTQKETQVVIADIQDVIPGEQVHGLDGGVWAPGLMLI